MIAEIIINRATRQLNKILHYKIPTEFGKIPVGTRVIVPLGKSKEEGIVIGYATSSSFTLKPILGVLDKEPWFTEEMLNTAKKISHHYLCSYAQSLELFTIDKKGLKEYSLPKERWIRIGKEIADESLLKRKPKQFALWTFLKSAQNISVRTLKEKGFSLPVIKALIDTGYVVEEWREKETKSQFSTFLSAFHIPLTEEQKTCFLPISMAIEEKKNKVFLLHGVTGSGKTQVYIRAAKECISLGRTCIVLVPEIILTTQIVERFVAAFGDEVVVFHSKLSKGERYNNWERLRRGESHIIIGARSAVFAPATDIGLIIIDEEHDSSYKQEDMVHYHARQVALWRGEAHSCPLILGSATPSMESYYRTQIKEYELLQLPNRIFENLMPEVNIVDMREELFYGNYSVFSSSLSQLISDVLTEKKQMIILLNRRGYSTFVMCRDCGKIMGCPHCDTSLVFHRHDERLRCHYCEYSESIPYTCPSCGTKKIKDFGTGTQKVEEELAKNFPEARIARLDQDTTSHKESGKEILSAFGEGKFDILLGTQMVSKGHDFENVAGVGILSADSILNLPLYSAAERTFNLLTQTVGRAGRGKSKGKAVIQTYNPLHYAIINSKTQNYLGFYNEEIELRRSLSYPPFGEMIHIKISHKEEHIALECAMTVRSLLYEYTRTSPTTAIDIYGPYEDGAKRVRNKYRFFIMIRGKNLTGIRNHIRESTIFSMENVSIDVDPI